MQYLLHSIDVVITWSYRNPPSCRIDICLICGTSRILHSPLWRDI